MENTNLAPTEKMGISRNRRVQPMTPRPAGTLVKTIVKPETAKAHMDGDMANHADCPASDLLKRKVNIGG